MWRFKSFQIVPADAAMGSVLQELIMSVLREYGWTPECNGIDSDVLDIEQNYRKDGGEFYAAFHEGELVATAGFKRIDAERCELRKMYMPPQWRGQGLGSFLVQLCEQEAKIRGFRVVELETATRLHEAIALYERKGYQLKTGTPHVGRCDRIYEKTLV